MPQPRKGPGRKRAFASKEKLDRFYGALFSGASFTVAADAAGVSRRCAEKERARNPEFARLVKEWREIGKARRVGVIMAHGMSKAKDAWKAMAWLLERLDWQEYSKRSPDQITPEQLAAAIGRMTTAILGEVPPEHHPKVIEKVETILEGLTGISNAGSSTTKPDQSETGDDGSASDPDGP